MTSTSKPIEEFPDYVVDVDGTVRHARTGRIRKASYTREGAVKITLFKDGKPYTRSLALIVAKAHLYNDHDPEIFDTPIHLDNDISNNHVDNLAWRPRWFASKYQHQYWNIDYRTSKVPVIDVQTGEVFPTIMSACQRYGVLFIDVWNCCVNGSHVFPTWRIFEFAD